jgi:hypothetical protein
MEDVHAVLDAVGSKRAALFGWSEGGPMSVLFAATYPERVSALALYATFASKDGGFGFATPEYAQRVRSRTKRMLEHWGEGRALDLVMPRLADSVALRQGFALLERASASPAMARGVLSAALQLDVRDILPTIRVPTVVIHRTDDAFIPVEAGRWMAGQIPRARFVELPGDIHHPWFGWRGVFGGRDDHRLGLGGHGGRRSGLGDRGRWRRGLGDRGRWAGHHPGGLHDPGVRHRSRHGHRHGRGHHAGRRLGHLLFRRPEDQRQNACKEVAMAKDPVQVAANVYSVLFENERVRLLEARVGPGESSALHSHPDCLIYNLTAGKMKFSSASGQSDEVEMRVSEVMWLEAQDHSAENVGDVETVALIFELK